VIEHENGEISSTAISIDYGCTDRIKDRFEGLSREREADEGEPDPEISRGSNHLYLRTFAGGYSVFLDRQFDVFDRLFIKLNDRTIATITGHSDRDESGTVIHDLFEEEGLANTLAFRYADRASNDPSCSGDVPTSGGSTSGGGDGDGPDAGEVAGGAAAGTGILLVNEVVNRTGRKGKDDAEDEPRDRGIDRSPPPKPPGTDGMIWDPNTMEWRYPRPGEVPLVYDPETNTWNEPSDDTDVPEGCAGAQTALTQAENELARLRLLANQARNKLARADAIHAENKYKAHLLLGWDAGSLVGGGVTAPLGVGVAGSAARQMDNWVPPASRRA